MRCMHSMPFGAELVTGGARFRLWAPAAERVELLLGDRRLELERRPDGFHERMVQGTAPGDRYAFAIEGLPRPVADPASRFNPEGPDAPSEVVDPTAFEWHDGDWRGRPWRDAVFYELHVGTFTADGTLAAAAEKLPELARLGVTAIELMPIAEGPGRRSWGYDAVLPFALRASSGRPDDLKAFVQTAHRLGLMVFLDVVYNHFGPSGNYLPHYAPQFFTKRHQTPWGDAINFDGEESAPVRAFFIENALFWLVEYRFDGLRLDAVHAIIDDSEPHVLTELAETVERRITEREVHLVLENGDNEARHLARRPDGRPRTYTAQWNDDFHHAMHVLLTSETSGYYEDYEEPARRLLRCLTEGFAYQGEPSRHWGGRSRGEPSRDLPPAAFVAFLQNHDQIGNRAFGERLSMLTSPDAMRAAETLLLLLPGPILIFMGDELRAPNPFPFFCDFDGELAEAVRQGRRDEFAQFFAAHDLASLPDPNDEKTFAAARIDWSARTRPEHADAAERYAALLALRHAVVTPRLPARRAEGRMLADRALTATWPLADGTRLGLVANLGDSPVMSDAWPRGRLLASSVPLPSPLPEHIPGWCAAWFLDEAGGSTALAEAEQLEEG